MKIIYFLPPKKNDFGGFIHFLKNWNQKKVSRAIREKLFSNFFTFNYEIKQAISKCEG